MTQGRWLYEEDDEPIERDPGEVVPKCTPETLTAFIRKWLKTNGREPDLRDIKQEFGGILGAHRAAWELDKQGKWPVTLEESDGTGTEQSDG